MTRRHVQTTSAVWVNFTQVGWHCWDNSDAPRYLQTPHRHLFHIKVQAEVSHKDRAVEFHWLKETAQKVLNMGWPRAEQDQFGLNFGGYSCEAIAEWLLVSLPEGVTAVEVSEDGECGARVEAVKMGR